MVKKTSKRPAKRPSAKAMAAAEALLAPLLGMQNLLKASVAQNELNAGMLTSLKDRVEQLAGQIDHLQKCVALDVPSPVGKLLTEPAPAPNNGLLTETFSREPKGNIP
jgi:hypothetical protein